MVNNKKHILLKYATTYKRFTGSLAPVGCHYDSYIGAWIVSNTGKLLVETSNPPTPTTKKADIETGEDQKGE